MTVRAQSIDNAWVFVSDPIVLYYDFPTIKDNPPAADLPEEPVEDFPSNPESSLWWIYVPEYTHENFINSTINESNISSMERGTAGINQSKTDVQAVLEQPFSTGGQAGTVPPKHLPAGQKGLSNQFLGPVAQDQPGPVGQICPSSWLLLWSDSARQTTGHTRLFEHRWNCRV
ncbi:hypothetical protein PCANC_27371 [Puccinia coronata f. sp. avenae]|uniref:Uncharacterized protein n=1 Tax=Puccinia coronata f. sp. avenae TaxID=200324 RepID=A0A2N5TVE1_9BASI|nr:hypothetical protein PCANC_27371 [Puccinia coronata f. sp. avenae]